MVIAGWHSGVELDLLTGLPSCSVSMDLSTMSVEDMLDTTGPGPQPSCGSVPWTFLGASMANWNAILSTGLVLLWIFAFTRRDVHP